VGLVRVFDISYSHRLELGPMPDVFVQREVTERASRARFPLMRGPPTKVGNPNLPQLGFLDLLLGVSFPADHNEIGGAWYLLDLVLGILELGVQLSRRGPLPRVVCEYNEDDNEEGAEESDGQDI